MRSKQDFDNEKVVKISNKIYSETALKYGPDSNAVRYGDQQSQYLRFAEIVRYIDMEGNGKHVLDVGCGNAELYKFLNFMGFRGRYTGYDINKHLLNIAKKRFKNIDVSLVDLMEQRPKKHFNYVVASGLFGLNIGQNMEWTFSLIKRMYDLCTEKTVFNMISSHVNFKEHDMFYVDPGEVLKFCIEKLSRRVALVHHNIPYNFTVVISKGAEWKSIA
ncbi:MAG: class I SAM-dependent methyltransferase [Nitrospirota bacterium]